MKATTNSNLIRQTSPMLCLLILCLTSLMAQEKLSYQMPPQEMVEIVDAPESPAVSISPNHQWMLMMARASLPSIEDLAQPELRIAGLRINPATNGPSRGRYYHGLKIKSLNGESEIEIEGLPDKVRISNVSWSPDGQQIAFAHTSEDMISLWVIDVSTAKAKKLSNKALNSAMRGSPYTWMANSKSIIFKSVVENRGNPPQKPRVPSGPVISENNGKVAAVRTYQDLLENAYDEALFSYYTESQLVQINLEGETENIGKSGIISSFSLSPDNQYILVEQLAKPFSYIVPYYRFPLNVGIWDIKGKLVKTVAELPLAEDVPKGFSAVRPGARSFNWRSDVASSLYWVEALDEGDPRKQVKYRDQLYHIEAPFDGEPLKSVATELRYAGIQWGTDDLAIIHEYWRKNRQRITSSFSPNNPQQKKVLFDRSTEDRYNDPGTFVSKKNENGQYVLLMANKGKSLVLRGSGASPEGNRPFIDEYRLKDRQTERLWRSEAPYYEYPVEILDIDKRQIVTSRESVDKPANYYLRNLKKETLRALTDFQHPYPQLKDVYKELLTYEREDGVQLSGTLYLPTGYKKGDGPLPLIMWAYPREFKSAKAASQISGSPYTFSRMSRTSVLMFLSVGYAVLANPTMPIIGEGDAEPNDTYVKQLVSSAAAAIDKVVEMGVADRDKIAIGGHSYGAFMTANLLAHSDLFACGIARSGAYNRTLTPFGFQAEERTFWEAPEIYFNMSPFMHAHKIKEPLLMLHGQADNNSGTFPVQSERFFAALKGHGATVRLVMLPHESHGYTARESVMHTLWESYQFLEKYINTDGVNR